MQFYQLGKISIMPIKTDGNDHINLFEVKAIEFS